MYTFTYELRTNGEGITEETFDIDSDTLRNEIAYANKEKGDPGSDVVDYRYEEKKQNQE